MEADTRRRVPRYADGDVVAFVAVVLALVAAWQSESEMRLTVATAVVMGAAAIAGANPATPVPRPLRGANTALLVVSLVLVSFLTLGAGLACQWPCREVFLAQTVMCTGCLTASFVYLWALRRNAPESGAVTASITVCPLVVLSLIAGLVLSGSA